MLIKENDGIKNDILDKKLNLSYLNQSSLNNDMDFSK